MSRFEVITAELLAASAAVDSTTTILQEMEAGISHEAGALVGTPAAGAYEAFVTGLHTTTTGLSKASGDLAAALIAASDAYERAEGSATDGVSSAGGFSGGGLDGGGASGGW